ncbi:MAG: bifunctional diguanylate cyclase/phosphodiesterase [Ilumatobacteraceae bacterium]
MKDAATTRVVLTISSITVLLGVGAVLGTLTLPSLTSSTRPSAWWVLPALAVAFGIAEQTVFHFEFRREAISFSLSEVPTALALIYLAPGPAIAARVIGGLAVITLQGRSRYYKLLFNAALFAAETAAAYHIVRFVVGRSPGSDLALLAAIVPATAGTTVLGSVFVALAIAVVEGKFRERLASELRMSSWMAPFNGLVAAAVVAPTLISPWLAFLSAAPVIAFWGLMQSYGSLEQRFRDLDDLHGFVGRVGRSLDLDEVMVAAVDDIAVLLRARRAAVVVFGADHPLCKTVGKPLPDLPESSDDLRWADVLGPRKGQLLGATEWHALGFEGMAAVGDALCAPVRDGESIVGLIVVAERVGAQGHFRNVDVVRLQTLSEQIAPNLRKALLHHRIEFEARHDALTGLPNRSSFERIVETELNGADLRNDDEVAVVMLMDLDRFKEINDTLGHNAGDTVLNDFAVRIKSLLGPRDVLARLAGDEFALLTFSHVGSIHAMAERLVDEARQPFAIDGLDVVVTMSVGVVVVSDDASDAGTLLRQADIAMYTAKSRHTGYELYSLDIDRRTPARLSMLGDLRSALESTDLQVFLQPKLDLASGIVVGVEALARWAHPRRGWVAPEDFVPVAEETGLIKQLTDQVLEASAAQLQRLRSLGHHLGLAVNLSTHDLLDELLPERVLRHLDRHDIDPTLLTLEITESSLLIDAPRARTTIERLNQQGIRLSVDDFGTGYSSLSYLRHLPVSELKIDRSFVANVLFDEQDEVIVRSIIDLGHNLGMQVVAEGVETDEVLNRLKGFDCDVAQGFGICRPVPLDSFVAWLSSTQHPSRRRDPLRPGHWFDNPTNPADLGSRPGEV